MLRDHTPEKRLHGFSAMPRIVLLEFVPLSATAEQICSWLAPLQVQRRQGKLELHWCRASDEEEGVEFTTVAASETTGTSPFLPSTSYFLLPLTSLPRWLS